MVPLHMGRGPAGSPCGEVEGGGEGRPLGESVTLPTPDMRAPRGPEGLRVPPHRPSDEGGKRGDLDPRARGSPFVVARVSKPVPPLLLIEGGGMGAPGPGPLTQRRFSHLWMATREEARGGM